MVWVIGIFLTLWSGCSGSDVSRQQQILGSWEVDSIRKVYNQFVSSEAGHAAMPIYEYLPGEKVRELKENDYREYRCEWKGNDTLLYRSPEGDTIGLYQILELRRNHLVLKKTQPSIFAGKGQNRYEIRFFSRKED